MTDSENTTAAAEAPAAPERPFLTVIKGNPTDEELGVLAAVFAAAASGASDEDETGTVNNWGRPADLHRPGHLAYSPSAFQNLNFY